MGGLLGEHRDDARLAAAGAVVFAASYLLLRAFGANFDLPPAHVEPAPSLGNASVATQDSRPFSA